MKKLMLMLTCLTMVLIGCQKEPELPFTPPKPKADPHCGVIIEKVIEYGTIFDSYSYKIKNDSSGNVIEVYVGSSQNNAPAEWVILNVGDNKCLTVSW